MIAIIYLTMLFSRHVVKDMEENCEYAITIDCNENKEEGGD
jgi:hypothetical protein